MQKDKLLTGSICLTDVLEKAKQKHSAFTKAQNGKIYFNVAAWLREHPDDYGNHLSILLQNKKDQNLEKTYIGRMKYWISEEPKPISNQDISSIPDVDDLPF